MVAAIFSTLRGLKLPIKVSIKGVPVKYKRSTLLLRLVTSLDEKKAKKKKEKTQH